MWSVSNTLQCKIRKYLSLIASALSKSIFKDVSDISRKIKGYVHFRSIEKFPVCFLLPEKSFKSELNQKAQRQDFLFILACVLRAGTCNKFLQKVALLLIVGAHLSAECKVPGRT